MSHQGGPDFHAAPADNLLQEGVRCLTAGELTRALECFDECLRLDADNAYAWNCAGITHRAARRFDQAVASFRQALQVRPHFPEAHNNLGNALQDLGQRNEAEQAYRAALAAEPRFADACNNLGVVLLAGDRPSEAISYFQQAVWLKLDFLEAHNNLGNAYRSIGELDAAEESYTTALRLAPQSAEVRLNLGNLLRDRGDLSAAREHYEAALRLNPESAVAWSSLAGVHTSRDELPEAVRCYEAAIALQPSAVDWHLKLGEVLQLQERIDLATRAYQRAIQLEPDNPLHALRVSSICPVVFGSQLEIDDFRVRALATWPRMRDTAYPTDCATPLVAPPFHLQFLDGDLRPLKEAYARIFEGRFPQPALAPRSGAPSVGLVVTYRHEAIFLRTLQNVLNKLPSGLAEFTIACPASSLAQLRPALRPDIRYLALPGSLLDAIELIRRRAFDVLYYYEIGSDVTNYFLPFLRLAPVQCTSWGIQVTSGIRSVDYYLSSALIEPLEAQDHYTETLLLSRALLTDPSRMPAHETPGARDRFGFDCDQHIYLSAQQPGKYHPAFDTALAGILRGDPAGLVVLTADGFGAATELLRTRMRRVMPDVAPRVLFLPRQYGVRYSELLAAADVLLDPPHFSGANSSYDGFALGKPIVTLPSAYQRGRYTLGCYRTMDVLDCVAADGDDYVRRAVALGTDREWREHVSGRILAASGRLFEDPAVVPEYERLFSELLAAAAKSS